MYKKILLAIDDSDNSFRALQEAITLSGSDSDSKISVLHVADIAKAKSEVLHAHTKEELEYFRRKKFKRFEGLLNEKNISYSFTILHGDPAQMIIDKANSNEYDALVIGGRDKKHSFLKDMILGSVSHKVAKRVLIPVIIVK